MSPYKTVYEALISSHAVFWCFKSHSPHAFIVSLDKVNAGLFTLKRTSHLIIEVKLNISVLREACNKK